MPTLDQLLDQLWRDYSRLNPHAQAIHDLLESRGETIINDHIALRTYNDPRINLDVLAQSFVKFGYQPRDRYSFKDKKLDAQHFEHTDPKRPKVFISELRLADCSPMLRHMVTGLIDQMPADFTARWDLPAAGRPWQLAYSDYEKLRSESEYAAWLAAFGFCANHFTVFVNALKTFDCLEQLNKLLTDEGYKLNTSGGAIKGSPDELLEQSSSLAGEVKVQFSDGTHAIPGCYYEFARRYPDEQGRIFQGFIAKSADKIFESTDRR